MSSKPITLLIRKEGKTLKSPDNQRSSSLLAVHVVGSTGQGGGLPPSGKEWVCE